MFSYRHKLDTLKKNHEKELATLKNSHERDMQSMMLAAKLELESTKREAEYERSKHSTEYKLLLDSKTTEVLHVTTLFEQKVIDTTSTFKIQVERLQEELAENEHTIQLLQKKLDSKVHNETDEGKTYNGSSRSVSPSSLARWVDTVSISACIWSE